MRRGIALALALALALLALLAAGCGSDDETVVGPTTTAKNENTAELVFFVATMLPDGLTITKATLNRSQEQPAEGWGAAIGVPDGTGYVGAIHVFISTMTVAEEAEPEPTDKDVTRIQIGEVSANYNRNELTGTMVWWRDDGRAVGVTGPYDGNDAVIDAARRLRVAPKGKVNESRFDGLPKGYTEIASGGGDATGRRNDYSMSASGSTPLKTVTITVRTLPKGFDQPTVAFGSEISTRTVRGRKASVGVSHAVSNGQTFDQMHLVWRERGDLLVSVQGLITEGEAFAIASGLEKRTEAQWRAALEVDEQT